MSKTKILFYILLKDTCLIFLFNRQLLDYFICFSIKKI